MRGRNTVASLFGATPQQIMAQQAERERSLLASVANNPYQQVGTAIGIGLGRLFGGESQEVQQARQLEAIGRDYQPGNIQNMAETYTKLKEAGAPAETLNRLSADITTASAQFNERAQEQRSRNAAIEYIASESPEFAELVKSGAYPVADAVKTTRDAKQQGTGLNAIADTLRKRGRPDLADAVTSRVMEPETALGLAPKDGATGVKTLEELTGMGNNLLQSYAPDSLKAANILRLQGPLEGESQESYALRVTNALQQKQKEVEPEKPLNFADFTGIGDTLLDSYSTGSRLAARKIFNEGPQEGETTPQFRKRVLDELMVGLSKEQKKRASELASSARVAVDGRPAFNKFFNEVDVAITGPGADFFTGVGRIINSIGGNIQGVPESEFINKLLSKEVLNSAQFMKGALSDRDIMFLQDTVGRLGNTKESLKYAFAALEAQKLVDQVVYEAYMRAPDKAAFNEAEVVREVQVEIYKRVSQARNVDL